MITSILSALIRTEKSIRAIFRITILASIILPFMIVLGIS